MNLTVFLNKALEASLHEASCLIMAAIFHQECAKTSPNIGIELEALDHGLVQLLCLLDK